MDHDFYISGHLFFVSYDFFWSLKSRSISLIKARTWHGSQDGRCSVGDSNRPDIWFFFISKHHSSLRCILELPRRICTSHWLQWPRVRSPINWRSLFLFSSMQALTYFDQSSQEDSLPTLGLDCLSHICFLLTKDLAVNMIFKPTKSLQPHETDACLFLAKVSASSFPFTPAGPNTHRTVTLVASS